MKNDGMGAFPDCVAPDGAGGLEYGHPGMTLRDYFAASALQGLLASETDEFRFTDPKLTDLGRTSEAAESAYDLADAMLMARNK